VILRTDLIKQVVGKNNIQRGDINISSELTEAVRCAKSLGYVVLGLLPLWCPIGVVVVLNFQLLFSEEELSPAPKRARTQMAPSQSSRVRCMFSKASSSSLCIQLPPAVRLLTGRDGR
jgi:hypothetical protein